MEITSTTMIIVVAVVVLVIVLLAVTALARSQRTKRLQEKFGPEYDRVVGDTIHQREAEKELEERIAHVDALDIRALTAEEVNRYALEWQATQREFVDEPHIALQNADRLIREVMNAKGYPVDDFEQRAADISVDYPELVTDYRGLHLIAAKKVNQKVDTEEMRQAMVHGRALFENLMKQQPREEETYQKEKI